MKLSIVLLLPFCYVAHAALLRQPGPTRLSINSSSSKDEELRPREGQPLLSPWSGLLVNSSGSGGVRLRQRNHVASQGKSAPPFKLTLTNHNGVQYTASVLVGGQDLQAIYDTGSFEVMAISRQCSICKLHEEQHAYDSSSSATFKEGGHGTEDHHFAGGTVKAREDYETVHVGSLDSPMKVESMPFWQVIETNMQVFLKKKAQFTAIVGMGHRNERGASDSESLIERTGIEKFAICLLPGLANPGYLTFNPAHNFADPGFHKIPVIGESHWAVALDQASTDLHGTPLHSCWVYGGQQDCVAIIDSGTSLIGVPPNAVIMIKTLIKRIKYDCSNLDDLPDLVFHIDGKPFPLPARAYTVHFGMKDGKPSRCLPAFTDISMSLKGANVWILGLPFLRHFYTVFDREGPSILVANQADNCEPALHNGALIEASAAAGRLRLQQPPTIADLSEATLPAWATADKHIQL